MDVIIISRFTKVNKKIEQALYLQTIPVDIFIVNAGYISRGGIKDIDYLESEKKARILAQEKALLLNKDIVCIQDEDKLCACPVTGVIREDNLEKAKKFLIDNKEWGAVSLVQKTKGYDVDNADSHIDIGFVVYKLECLKNINFDIPVTENKKCFCSDVTLQIRKLGYKFTYLDNINRITHTKGGI